MLHLLRTNAIEGGIFGRLLMKDGTVIAFTLEHAYPLGNVPGYRAKIPPGVFLCVRGPHRLKGMTEDFLTYEVTGITGHSGLIFHWGNYNADSEGCILLGTRREGDMVINSKIAFRRFLLLVEHKDTFFLVVEDPHEGTTGKTPD